MRGTTLCLSILTKVIESYMMMPAKKNIPIKLNMKEFDCGSGLLLELFLNEKDESFTQLPNMEPNGALIDGLAEAFAQVLRNHRFQAAFLQ